MTETAPRASDSWPFGQAIRAARGTRSVRSAAKAAGLSEGRWRQLENGFAWARGGQKIDARPSPETTIAMADELGLDRSEALRLAGIAPEEHRELLATPAPHRLLRQEFAPRTPEQEPAGPRDELTHAPPDFGDDPLAQMTYAQLQRRGSLWVREVVDLAGPRMQPMRRDLAAARERAQALREDLREALRGLADAVVSDSPDVAELRGLVERAGSTQLQLDVEESRIEYLRHELEFQRRQAANDMARDLEGLAHEVAAEARREHGFDEGPAPDFDITWTEPDGTQRIVQLKTGSPASTPSEVAQWITEAVESTSSTIVFLSAPHSRVVDVVPLADLVHEFERAGQRVAVVEPRPRADDVQAPVGAS